jgi:leader peptidase (prepilin peptidase)/N-methyltransferase
VGGTRSHGRDARHARRAGTRGGRTLNTDNPTLLAGAAVLGAIIGFAADRLAARWPAHAGGAIRRMDWRTAVVTIGAAVAFGLLAARWTEPRDLAVLGIWFAALTLLLATDLDQRLLPDLVTLPLIPFALIVVLLGWDPLLAGKSLGIVSGIVAGVLAPIGLLVSDRLFGGSLGLGDVKLSVSLGLMCGIYLLIAGFLVASVVFAVVLGVLIVLGRLKLSSHIPFGPILILAGVFAALVPSVQA